SLLLQFLTVAAVRDSAEDAPIPSSTNRRKLAVVRRGEAKRQQTRQLQTSSASSARTSATFTSPFLILAPTIPPPSPAVVPISLNSSDSADREALLVSATCPQNQNTHTLLPQLPQDPSMSACSAAPSHLSESIPNSNQHALTLSTASTVNSLNFPARRGRRAANKLTLQARRGRELEQKAAHPVSSSSVSTSLCESTALLSDQSQQSRNDPMELSTADNSNNNVPQLSTSDLQQVLSLEESAAFALLSLSSSIVTGF